MLSSPLGCRLDLRVSALSGPHPCSLALRPGDLLPSRRWPCRWASEIRFPSSLPSELQGSGFYLGGSDSRRTRPPSLDAQLGRRISRTRLSDERSCLRPRKARRSQLKARETVVSPESLVREAHCSPRPHLVLTTESPTQPPGGMPINRRVGRVNLPQGEDALDACRTWACADVGTARVWAVVASNPVTKELDRFLRHPAAPGLPGVDRQLQTLHKGLRDNMDGSSRQKVTLGEISLNMLGVRFAQS